MLGPDVVVTQLQRLAQRQLEHLLGAGRERDVARRRLPAVADDLLHLGAHGLQRDAERLERLRGDSFTLVDETEQDVLGPDVVVVEQARFLLGKDNDPSRSVGEALEQNEPPLGEPVCSFYRPVGPLLWRRAESETDLSGMIPAHRGADKGGLVDDWFRKLSGTPASL